MVVLAAPLASAPASNAPAGRTGVLRGAQAHQAILDAEPGQRFRVQTIYTIVAFDVIRPAVLRLGGRHGEHLRCDGPPGPAVALIDLASVTAARELT